MNNHAQRDEETWAAVETGLIRLRAAYDERDAARDAVCSGEWSDDEDDYFNLTDADRRLAFAQDELSRAHVKRADWLGLDQKYDKDYKEQTQ